MKRICMVKQKTVETFQIWGKKVVEFHRLAEKDHARLKWLKDTLKAFFNFGNKQQVYEVIFFWYVKVCIFWKYIQYTIHWDKTQILQKLPSDKINGIKNVLFFFRQLQLITALLLFEIRLWAEAQGLSLYIYVGFSIFNSVSFLLKFILLSYKMHGLFEFKTS